jgi:hypothetical protein
MLRRGGSLQHKKNSPSSIFEMQPTSSSSRRARNANSSSKGGDGGVVVRQRSYSSSASGQPSSSLLAVSGQDVTGDIRRSNTTGKRFEGLKRRLGSLRRKPVPDEA